MMVVSISSSYSLLAYFQFRCKAYLSKEYLLVALLGSTLTRKGWALAFYSPGSTENVSKKYRENLSVTCPGGDLSERKSRSVPSGRTSFKRVFLKGKALTEHRWKKRKEASRRKDERHSQIFAAISPRRSCE